MTREIVLDTETTGLDPAQGHRIVEVAALELVDRLPTGRTFQTYINPDRDMPEEAFRVHGLSAEYLADFPLFDEIVEPMLEFLGDSPLVIHNAAFDIRFLDHELKRAGRSILGSERATCTLIMAQRRFPGAAASLDALCRRFSVDTTARTLHGGLVDCQLLAEVYLHLHGGRQVGLDLAMAAIGQQAAANGALAAPRIARPARPHAASPEELAAHAALVGKLGDAVWNR